MFFFFALAIVFFLLFCGFDNIKTGNEKYIIKIVVFVLLSCNSFKYF